MNELKIFENPEFGKVRTVTIDGEPWLVGKDVAIALGYTNPKKALIDHVDQEDKLQGDGVTIRDPMGREQHPTIINESGVYSLIFSSKLPSAKKFKHWVTSEVLPAIRKTGGYMTPAAKEQLEALVKSQAALARSLAEQVRTQVKQEEAIKALTRKVAALESLGPEVRVIPKRKPEVSLTGLARAAAAARKAVLDTGGNRFEAGMEVLSILDYYGLPVPQWVKRESHKCLGGIAVNLEDFL